MMITVSCCSIAVSNTSDSEWHIGLELLVFCGAKGGCATENEAEKTGNGRGKPDSSSNEILLLTIVSRTLRSRSVLSSAALLSRESML